MTGDIKRREHRLASIFFIARLPRFRLDLALESTSNVIIVVIIKLNAKHITVVTHNKSPAVDAGFIVTSNAIWLSNPVVYKIILSHKLTLPFKNKCIILKLRLGRPAEKEKPHLPAAILMRSLEG